jgi:hypothetical protein
MTLNRRDFLASGVGAMSALSGAQDSFRYRGYLGWITDLATLPDTNAAWPSMRIDRQLLKDYSQTFGVMKEIGLQDLCIWGLYVSRAWPVDIASAVQPQRAKLVEQLIADAHKNHIRVVSGLGIYSWGFDEILKANPQLAKTSPNAMCGSDERSWEWMRKVIDFVFTRFPIDGVSMQSADQGRCKCDQCSRFSDTEYHARLNIRCADYIRSRWPKKVVAVSGWGMRFEDPASLPHLVELSRHIDYLIDVTDSSRRRDPALRQKLIAELHCAFGTLGGPQVEPPQHWARDRWFLPTVRRVGDHLTALYADGGRACEWFYHILANPGDEVSTWVAGKFLSNPSVTWQKHLDTTVERLYRVRQSEVRQALCEAFLAAEDAYFRYIPPTTCGTISMEPLVSSAPGPPVYLTKRLSAAERAQYSESLERTREQFEKLLPEIPEKKRMQRILSCIDNARKDCKSV